MEALGHFLQWCAMIPHTDIGSSMFDFVFRLAVPNIYLDSVKHPETCPISLDDFLQIYAAWAVLNIDYGARKGVVFRYAASRPSVVL